VALPVGIGLGLPHLAKTGLRPVAVAGLLALLAGLVLLLVGGESLVRSRGGWRRYVVTIPALVVAVVLATTVLGQAVALTNVPPTSIGTTTPADRGLSYRDVEFRTPDGVALSGWYVPSRNGAAVALLHGAGSTRSAVLEHAEVPAQDGLGVLLFESVTDLLTPASQPGTLRAAVAAAPTTPVLLIAAGADPDEHHAARYIQAGSPGSVQIWDAPGAGHVGALNTHPAEWRERVTTFLGTAFRGTR
jgi:hypothetical protein